jgi:RNA polymerase sigma factor (sigma-70 family)
MSETAAAIEAVWKIESPRLIAGLVRQTGDIELAEDLAQDALVAALEQWPGDGVPANPGAWLTVTAKRRAFDLFRRNRRLAAKYEEIGQDPTAQTALGMPDIEAIDNPIDEDLLGLVFMACHPVLSMDARVALTLRCLGGLSTEEVGRAFLVPTSAIAQRVVRAKRTLVEAQVPFEIPCGDELAARLPAVLEVIYLIFNEGYAATSGDDWLRPDLCQDALRLGRMLAKLMPDESEVHGLVALMEIQASRLHARTGPNGEPVLLLDQDRGRWDHLLISRGLDALNRAEQAGAPLGQYALQAAIAACHARARTAEETDWERIVALYDALAQLTGSAIVDLNRAVAVAMAYGPASGLELVERLSGEPSLREYHLLPSVRGDLLEKLGRQGEASVQFQRAAALTRNTAEQRLLLARAGRCAGAAERHADNQGGADHA